MIFKDFLNNEVTRSIFPDILDDLEKINEVNKTEFDLFCEEQKKMLQDFMKLHNIKQE